MQGMFTFVNISVGEGGQQWDIAITDFFNLKLFLGISY